MLTNLIDSTPIGAHAIIRLDTFFSKINRSRRPMQVIVVNRDKNDVLCKDIYLLRPLCKPTFLISIEQLRPKKRAEIMNVQNILLPVLLVGLRRSFHNELPVEVDDLVVQPLLGLQADDVRIIDL